MSLDNAPAPAATPLPAPAHSAVRTDARDAIDAEFSVLAAKITRETAFPCASYKPQVLRRRIAVRMRACNVGSYPEYACVLDDDPREYAQLLDALTVNVTRFFRDRPMYEGLADVVIPTLWSARGDRIAVWSAGTASGEEAYSLAALFHEEARRRGELHRLGHVHILGTDIDRTSLLAAARAEYPPSAFSETPKPLLDTLFPRTGAPGTVDTRAVAPRVRAMVRLEWRDLLQPHAARASYDLIACRNVIIYLDREAQVTLLETLHAALRPGGYLVLGRAEMLLGRTRARFAPVVPRERIFQRADHLTRVAGRDRG